MHTRTTLIDDKEGVRLERIEGLSADGTVVQELYKLWTARPTSPRFLTDGYDARAAFKQEVIASINASPVTREIK